MCGPLERVVEVVVDRDSLDFDVPPPILAAELFDIGHTAGLRQLSHDLPPVVEQADSAPA